MAVPVRVTWMPCDGSVQGILLRCTGHGLPFTFCLCVSLCVCLWARVWCCFFLNVWSLSAEVRWDLHLTTLLLMHCAFYYMGLLLLFASCSMFLPHVLYQHAQSVLLLCWKWSKQLSVWEWGCSVVFTKMKSDEDLCYGWRSRSSPFWVKEAYYLTMSDR